MNLRFIAPDEFADAYLGLELSASAPWAELVYGDLDLARRVHGRLVAARIGEFAPPFGFIVLDESGVPVGMVAGPLARKELDQARFRAAIALSKDPEFGAPQREAASATRSAMFAVADGDAYLSRISVAESARGRGVGRAILEYFLIQSRHRGARRAVLEVSPRHESALAMYARAGFTTVGEGTARSQGRTLAYRHLALTL